MNTHEQLAALTTRLESDGWTRLNGNTWASPGDGYTLRTAYCHQEATLLLMQADTSAVQEPVYYRGPNPVAWADSVGFPL